MADPRSQHETFLFGIKRDLANRKTDLERSLQIQLNRFRKTKLPGLIVIGAQKAGTGSIVKYLNSHPTLQKAILKETRFFSQDYHYQRGMEWYQRLFGPIQASATMTFEASPDYMMIPGVAERIKASLPEVKIIALLRDPVKRAYSSWNMYRMIRHDPIAQKNMRRRHLKYLSPSGKKEFLRTITDFGLDDFRQTVQEELSMPEFHDMNQGLTFVRNGIYADRLAPFWAQFPKEQILTIESSRFKSETAACLNTICNFLEIPPHTWEDNKLAPHHIRPYQEKMDPEAARILKDFYAPHNERLYLSLGERFTW